MVDCHSRESELQTNVLSALPQMCDSKKNEILTLAAATRATFHSLTANVAFAHSLKRGVAVACEAPSPSFSSVERHRRVKPAEKFIMGGKEMDTTTSSPEIHLVMGSLAYTSSFRVFIVCRRDSPASFVRPTAYKASQRCCPIVISRPSNFQPDICQMS